MTNMNFPELKIIDKVKNEDPNRDAVKELLVVKLDWSEIDEKILQHVFDETAKNRAK